jgi:imidazoleglycerol-phosphate dehydratase
MADKKVANPVAKKVVKPVTKPVVKQAATKIAKGRGAIVNRATGETKVSVELTLDGKGVCKAKTGIGMLDHLIEQIARHGLFDITVEAKGDMKTGQHHTLEDVAICLGQAFDKALGDRKGIARMGHAVVPMDEALSLVAIDISGRGFAVVEAPIEGKDVGGLDTDLVRHFLQTFATEAKLTLHARLMAKGNDHHKVECLFKALAKSLDIATRIDERVVDIPSTKGKL